MPSPSVAYSASLHSVHNKEVKEYSFTWSCDTIKTLKLLTKLTKQPLGYQPNQWWAKHQCFKWPALPHHHGWQISGETAGFQNVAFSITWIRMLAWQEFREEMKTTTTKLVVQIKRQRYCQINVNCEQKSVFSRF